MPNKTLKIALAVVGLCLLPISARAETRTMTLIARDDTSVTSTAAGQPNGTASSLLVDYASAGGQQSVAYLAFDLSELPRDVVVSSAVLTLFTNTVVTTGDIKIR